VKRLLAAAACGYLAGSVSFADLASARWSGRRDRLRMSGSGNPGAMNARRLLGRRAGAAVVAADVGKGVAACVLGRALASDAGAHVGGVAAVAGHCYPVWSGGRGGKGAAKSFGQCLATFPAYAPLDIAVALGASRLVGGRNPAFAATGLAAAAWTVAGAFWWRLGLRNLWGPPPTALLPLANAASTAVIASRFVASIRRGELDELLLDR
jgi:glycerol-3-phosphate acyltransferase PlsY